MMNHQELIKLTNTFDSIGFMYHALKTDCVPSRKRISDFNEERWEDLLSYAKANYEYLEEDNFIYDETSANGERNIKTLLHLKKNITLYNPFADCVELVFDSSSDKEALENLKNHFDKLGNQKTSHSIGLIRNHRGLMDIKFFDYKLPDHSLIPYMGEATKTLYDDMVHGLNEDLTNGLYLLYGQTGTGKTSFIKEVIKEVSSETLFISPAYTQGLTSPELVSLLMKHPGSILVIEDAETVLMERKADNSSAVSNLLNLTDGFLADFLNLNIICTFNTELDNIDKALLRDGRLKGMHEFEKINPERAKEIAAVLGNNINPEEPMTLAEICNFKATSKKYNSKIIGFAD